MISPFGKVHGFHQGFCGKNLVCEIKDEVSKHNQTLIVWPQQGEKEQAFVAVDVFKLYLSELDQKRNTPSSGSSDRFPMKVKRLAAFFF